MPEESGKPLPPPLQREMERAFGADFSDVRVHLGSSKPSGLGAKAYAAGNDIHFVPGAYDPVSPKGQELIAHELAHVVQQRDRPNRGGTTAERALAEAKAEELTAQALAKLAKKQ
jgi:hypothetical protein